MNILGLLFYNGFLTGVIVAVILECMYILLLVSFYLKFNLFGMQVFATEFKK